MATDEQAMACRGVGITSLILNVRSIWPFNAAEKLTDLADQTHRLSPLLAMSVERQELLALSGIREVRFSVLASAGSPSGGATEAPR